MRYKVLQCTTKLEQGRDSTSIPSYRYRNSQYEDRTLSWPFYLHIGNPYTWKDGLLNWGPVYVIFGVPLKIQNRLDGKFRWHTLRWRRNGHGDVSNHQPHHCLLNRLFGCRSKKTSKLRVTGLCVGNSPGAGEFPAQMTNNAENVSIWWRHHDENGFQWL